MMRRSRPPTARLVRRNYGFNERSHDKENGVAPSWRIIGKAGLVTTVGGRRDIPHRLTPERAEASPALAGRAVNLTDIRAGRAAGAAGCRPVHASPRGPPACRPPRWSIR